MHAGNHGKCLLCGDKYSLVQALSLETCERLKCWAVESVLKTLPRFFNLFISRSKLSVTR